MITILGYQILELLYNSRRSLVYRYYREADHQRMIAKILNPEQLNARRTMRFQREYDMVSSLSSDHIIKTYGLEKFQHSYVILFEDIDATSLDRIFSSKQIDLKQFFTLAIAITSALDEIQQQGIIHKDVNPANILWNPDTDQLKLIDFGIATKLSRETPVLVNPNMLEGTLPYISPEQTGRMNRGVDYRTDFYSLGVTFYVLLTGQLPFESRDPLELVHAHIAKPPVPPSDLNANIPRTISDIILKLMAKTAEERYQSAFGLKADLQTCLEQYTASQHVAYFEVGRQDVPYKFQVTQKLYGRETEIDQLLRVFDQASRGGMEMILVAGYSGVGKSALVHEIQKPIVRQKGYFIEGKCDQFHCDVPYSALIKALQAFVLQILTEPEARLEYWKAQLLQALGVNGQILVNLVPQLEQIIGPQPPLLDLPPTESQNRFWLTFSNALRAVARPEHPLVVFLDDLQWADIPTISLLEHLMTGREQRHCLLLGAYRSNEVDEGHSLMLALERIRKVQPVRQLQLAPLEKDSVNHIIADTLYQATDKVTSLTDLVYQQTEGNPFFINEVLTHLYQEKMIYFDHETGTWRWDSEQIARADMTTHVVDFMISRLRKLPQNTQSALQLASCIGERFDLKILSIIEEQSPAVVANEFWDALRAGLLIPLNADYQLVHVQSDDMQEEVLDSGVMVYKFRHDRIQQAAYSLVPEDKKQHTHLHIGRLMQQHLNAKEQTENALEIVRQLNEGRRLLDDNVERLELAKLNLAVAKKGRASAAYRPAFEYITVAVELLPEQAWEARASLTSKIYRELSICAYLCAEFDIAEAHCKTLLEHAKTPLEQAEIRFMQLVQYAYNRRMEEAIQAGTLGLRLLGISIPAKPGQGDVLKELLLAKWNLKRRKIADLINQPVLSDDTIILSMKILIDFITPSYLTGNANLFGLTVLKAANLSLKHGHSPDSAFGYANYAVLLAAMGDLKSAYEFGKLGLAVNDSFQDTEGRSRTLTMYALFGHSWKHHWKTLTPLFAEAVEAGLQSGDFWFVSQACIYVVLWNSTIPLQEAIEQGKHYLAISRETHTQSTLDAAEIHQAMRIKLCAETDVDHSPTATTPKEEQRLTRMRDEDNFVSGVAMHHIDSLKVCVFYENYTQALTHIQETDKVLQALMGTPFTAEFCFFAFLALAALLPDMPPTEKKATWKRLKKQYAQMKK